MANFGERPGDTVQNVVLSKTFRQDNRTQVFKCLTTSKVTEVTKGHTVYKK